MGGLKPGEVVAESGVEIPKAEIRNPKKIRKPKSERSAKTVFRICGFGLLSALGFRISALVLLRLVWESASIPFPYGLLAVTSFNA
jgi:hypothetical protein